jgi:hypothetical protein
MAIVLTALAAATCANGSTTGAKYPRRSPNCPIRIIHGPTPTVAEWEDLGMAEASCYLDDGPSTCLMRLKAEGCRMGGDMIYDVPKHPERPTERAMVYRGHVAHTKVAEKKPEPPAEEPVDAASGPVVPIGVAPPAGDAKASSPDAAVPPNP